MAGKWANFALGEIAVNLDSRRVPVKQSDRVPGPYPYYGASGIVDHVDGYLFDGNYLLVAEDGENLKTRQTPVAFMASGKFWVNNHAHILQGGDRARTRYLAYALSVADISAYLTGAVMPKLTQGNLARIPIPLPSLKEQDAIVDILGALDDKIELNLRMTTALEDTARALFKSWFIDFDPVRAKAESRPTGLPDATADLFPDTIGENGLPKGWSMKKVVDGCHAIFSGGTPATNRPEFWNGTLPWFSSGETRNRFVTRTEKQITQQAVENSATRVARKGSTVIASAGQGNTRGQTSLLLLDTHVNQSVVVLQADTSVSSDLFLFFDLERRYDEFRRVSDGQSSRGSLTTKLIGSLPALCPDTNLVLLFDKTVRPLIDRIASLLSQAENLQAIRDTLLPKLIAGEVRINNAGAAVAAA